MISPATMLFDKQLRETTVTHPALRRRPSVFWIIVKRTQSGCAPAIRGSAAEFGPDLQCLREIEAMLEMVVNDESKRKR